MRNHFCIWFALQVSAWFRDWHSLLSFLLRLSASAKTEIHLISLPPKARGVGVCLRWTQLPGFEPADIAPSRGEVFTESYHGDSTEAPETSTETTSSSNSSGNFSSELSSSTFLQTSALPSTTDSPIADAPKRKGVKGRRKLPPPPPTTTTTTTTTTRRVPFTFGDVQPNDQPLSSKGGRKGKYHSFIREFNEIQNDEGYAGGEESLDETFEGCWAVDNVLIVNMAHLPAAIEEQFDPIDPSHWLFFPGAHVQVNCLMIIIIFM